MTLPANSGPLSRRRVGKGDPVDAEMAARSVLAGVARDQPKSGLDKVEMIRMLKIVKDSAIKARTQAINQMKALIVTAPSELRPDLGRPPPHYPPGWAVPLLTKHDHPVLRG